MLASLPLHLRPPLLRCSALLVLLALTGLASAQGDDVRVTPSKDRSFRIPFQTQSGERNLREVQLFCSTDQGRSWRRCASAVPGQAHFEPFTAPQDGTYWFAVRTVDLQGRLYPPTDDQLHAGLKVLVKTSSPVVNLKALAPRDGYVGVEWEVRDDNLDLNSLRLEYRNAAGGQWLPVRIDAVASGHGYWTPATNGPLEARLTAHDTAGNVGEARASLAPGAANGSGAVTPPPATQGGNPNVRMVNSKRVSLNYRLDDVGPSGAVVELWYTRDGRSWQKYSEDTKPQPPYVFDVQEDGVYGFTLVVRSGVGLGDKLPQVGDAPQLWVEVDTVKPVAKLLGAEVGRGLEAGNMTITWTATDKNLGKQPITLAYSEAAEGPWTPIASNLENTGRYIWRMPASGVPYQFFVRVEAADRAGNVGVAQTAEKIKVDLSRPKVSILDVGAAGK